MEGWTLHFLGICNSQLIQHNQQLQGDLGWICTGWKKMALKVISVMNQEEPCFFKRRRIQKLILFSDSMFWSQVELPEVTKVTPPSFLSCPTSHTNSPDRFLVLRARIQQARSQILPVPASQAAFPTMAKWLIPLFHYPVLPSLFHYSIIPLFHHYGLFHQEWNPSMTYLMLFWSAGVEINTFRPWVCVSGAVLRSLRPIFNSTSWGAL